MGHVCARDSIHHRLAFPSRGSIILSEGWAVNLLGRRRSSNTIIRSTSGQNLNGRDGLKFVFDSLRFVLLEITIEIVPRSKCGIFFFMFFVSGFAFPWELLDRFDGQLRDLMLKP
ncbi:hypothetical protein CEXT_617911 [Caerostris extrusa]|uniref:Uncharacterized protein n=1 Tax=Caerostris extrusa TaxID=172846 RepID=A0AAV4MQF4_CAEEX|nr:hypothetical protein CEXT_617911 [Caerostris extrusa]